MRGILSIAGYVPYRRLQRSAVAAVFGSGGGKGTRSVASHDEDTTTMGVEAARLALRSAPGAATEAIWFATATPAYLDKTNASAIHSALRQPAHVAAFDFGGALRSGVGALRSALAAGGSGTTLVVVSDMRDGLPTSADESAGGDGAAAVVVGDGEAGSPVIAEYLGAASVTDEFLDRWRTAGNRRSKVWEERFGETRYVPLGAEAWESALKVAGLTADQVELVAVTGMHGRAAKALTRKLALGDGVVVDDLTSSVGQTGTAHPGLVLASMLERAQPGQVVAVVALADGADVLLFRATEALSSWAAAEPVADQIAGAADLSYGKFLSWRGMVTTEPPRRPEPQRVSATAAWRNEEWKFGFVGSRDRSSEAVHLPPARVSMKGGAVDDMDPVERADSGATIATYTIDRLAYSPSPPIVFAVLDFDGGGRFPVELTDVDPDRVEIGDRVTMTFRKLFTADGIHDYFWKAKPARVAPSDDRPPGD
ncbi:MAG TPA: OB-fold domain-containing protein [Acidimicrobiales bacterium]|jgi:3-hydroxy-3-methylglutaryl CoA synthase|nr:OB-fold domain-containing protein [Acidimicrobiales bacterium]